MPIEDLRKTLGAMTGGPQTPLSEQVYARDKQGKILKFGSAHEARLFGTDVLGSVAEMGPGGAAGVQRPTMTNLLDPSGMLKSQYQLKARGPIAFEGGFDKVNQEALQELRKRGLAVGPTEQAKYLTEQQQLQEQDLLGNIGRQQAAAQASAFGEMARRGGVSSGARERLATGGARELALGQQGALREGMKSRLGILSQDEAQKLGLLQNIPGMELGLGQLRETELGRKQGLAEKERGYQTDVERMNLMAALGEVARQDKAKMDEYREKMQAYGAEKTAEAQANAGKK